MEDLLPNKSTRNWLLLLNTSRSEYIYFVLIVTYIIMQVCWYLVVRSDTGLLRDCYRGINASYLDISIESSECKPLVGRYGDCNIYIISKHKTRLF